MTRPDDPEGLLICPECGYENPDDFYFTRAKHKCVGCSSCIRVFGWWDVSEEELEN